MKISYNWLKWYIPEVPNPEELRDIFTYHLCEVEGIEKKGEDENIDTIFDINILPNRAHDLLSHQGIAKELASLLHIQYVDPTSKYKVPESKPTSLKIEIQSDKCRRYMGRIVRNVKVEPSPLWVKTHLESIGQRSINNIVDAANIVMYDSGQPIHAFDLNKIKDNSLIIRQAESNEKIITLDNRDWTLKSSDLVIADSETALAVAGIKGGKVAEVDENTKNIILEVANFDPVSIRKTAQSLNIFTDARKRFENDLSPELCDFAMLELSGLIAEYGFSEFEDVVDIYPKKQEERRLIFSAERMSKILGLPVSIIEIGNILERYKIGYKNDGDIFEINVPPMRLDLVIEEDMAEEIGRIIGYEKVIPKIPQINFKPKINEIYSKIISAREKLLNEGYSEVITYTFKDKGEVSVLASASDKKFLRTNLSDGLKESIKLNKLNAPILNINNTKVFEIGTVFLKNKEEIHIAYGDSKEVKEFSLEDFGEKNNEIQNFLSPRKGVSQTFENSASGSNSKTFKMWSLFPFITRDIAVWIPEGEDVANLKKIISDNLPILSVSEPYMFDSFTKDGKTSYGFRFVFQSYERTLTDSEVNDIMTNITNKINSNNNWQVR